MDFASGFLFPFGHMKTAASAAKTLKLANRAARTVSLNKTLLKSKAVTSRLFLPNKKIQSLSRGAENINAGTNLTKKLSQLEAAQRSAESVRILPNNKVRYYGRENLANKPGKTRGRKYVTELDRSTGRVRTWMECYDHSGKVNRVHPKQINGQDLTTPHYPPTARELGIYE